MLAEYLAGNRQQGNFMYPSAVDNFKRQFAHLEGGGVSGRAGQQNLGQVSWRPERQFGNVLNVCVLAPAVAHDLCKGKHGQKLLQMSIGPMWAACPVTLMQDSHVACGSHCRQQACRENG